MSEQRLIDANALKEMGATCFARRNEKGKLEAIISIDNAPTIELESLIKPVAEIKCDISEEDKQKLLELLRKERPQLVILEPERPKGEWITIADVMSVFDDFMRGDVDENDTETFLLMLKDRAGR